MRPYDLLRISAAIRAHAVRQGENSRRVEEYMTALTGTEPVRSADQASSQTKDRPEATNLDGRYGKIGIPAVAAALQFAGAAKNPAYAPVVLRFDESRFEAAA